MCVMQACVFRINLKGWKHISSQAEKRTDETSSDSTSGLVGIKKGDSVAAGYGQSN